MKKVIEKYYPKYKVEKVLSPVMHGIGITDKHYYEITVHLKKIPGPKPQKNKSQNSRKHYSDDSPEPYYHGESIETIERNEGHGFWGNSSSGYITDEQERNMR